MGYNKTSANPIMLEIPSKREGYQSVILLKVPVRVP
jgi:hypothetical protein